jgi:hypothetical protein
MCAMGDVTTEFPAFQVLPEPQLVFDPIDPDQRHPHPLRGLARFGPYSKRLLGPAMSAIRLAAVTPAGETGKLAGLVEELAASQVPRERKAYLPKFPGFPDVFGVQLTLGATSTRLELPADLEEAIQHGPEPHRALAEALGRALGQLDQFRTAFDVAAIYLPSRWESAFTGGPNEDFDLHDYVKAIAASRNLPTQLVREDQALDYFCRCSVGWRLGIALYTKAGGTPWKLADMEPDAAYIGLSYALRPDSAGLPRFVTCCSQVFDADGGGLEFIAYEAESATIERDNPYLSRADMRAVMARSVRLYQDRHAGRLPRRLVVHKTTAFKDGEIDGCFDAWSAVRHREIELIQVQAASAWRGIHLLEPQQSGERSRPDPYPVHRGTMVHLSGTEVLLWVQGNAPTAVNGANFFKEQRGIPRPLLLTRHAGQGPASEFCREVLALSKMNWNNDSLYDFLPTTLDYAQTLARTLKRMPVIDPRPYPFRLFM